MKNRPDKMILAAATLALLTVLAVGPAVPNADVQLVKPANVAGWDGLHGLLAQPAAGGGSGT